MRKRVSLLTAVLGAVLLLAAGVQAQTTERVSVASDGTPGLRDSFNRPLHQRDRDAAIAGRADRLQNVAIAEGLGVTGHLERELLGVDALGNVDRQHQLEVDRPGLRRARQGDGAEHRRQGGAQRQPPPAARRARSRIEGLAHDDAGAI